MSYNVDHIGGFLNKARVLASGRVPCRRCGGYGIYHTYGRCFRCNGSRVDPVQAKNPAKTKKFAAELEQLKATGAHLVSAGYIDASWWEMVQPVASGQ